MDTKKRNIIIGAVAAGVVLITIGVFVVLGTFRGFDPKNYVGAVLDQSLKGDVKAAEQLMEGTTEDALYAQYEAGIRSFVKNSIISGVELDAELEEKYVALCEKVFGAMKYKVQDAKETEDGGYEVAVTYQPSNIFLNFIAAIGEENQRLVEKVENGEYRGTLEEINSQMQQDFLNNAYTLFEESYNTMEYGEEESFTFIIVKDEDGMYDISEEQITKFITKIMSLDEIQD